MMPALPEAFPSTAQHCPAGQSSAQPAAAFGAQPHKQQRKHPHRHCRYLWSTTRARTTTVTPLKSERVQHCLLPLCKGQSVTAEQQQGCTSAHVHLPPGLHFHTMQSQMTKSGTINPSDVEAFYEKLHLPLIYPLV